MKGTLCLVALLGGFAAPALAQQADTLLLDSLSFIRSKRMSEVDLAKKREGALRRVCPICPRTR